jgi:hypothetical protein
MAFARFTRMDWTNPDDPTLDRPIDVNPAHIAHYSEDTLHGHIATNNLYAKHPKRIGGTVLFMAQGGVICIVEPFEFVAIQLASAQRRERDASRV